VTVLAAAAVLTPGSAATAATTTSAPLVDAPFDRARDSTDAAGLKLVVRDLVLPPARDLAFTVRSLGGSSSRTDTGNHTDVSLSNDVLFAFGKSSLTPAAGALLRTVAADLTAHAKGTVSVTGYTDSVGTDTVNLPLSRARATTVVAALRPLVRAPVTFVAAGRGSTDPVAPNTTRQGADNPRGRALNRRVTIRFATG
jgi:outer membrane protein OmpA-like peptidoglycan-associated protein